MQKLHLDGFFHILSLTQEPFILQYIVTLTPLMSMYVEIPGQRDGLLVMMMYCTTLTMCYIFITTLPYPRSSENRREVKKGVIFPLFFRNFQLSNFFKEQQANLT